MLSNIWNTVLYEPLLNALAFLVSITPGEDVGIAVVILTILVKIILFPLSQKSIESQAEMNILSPELKKIKESGASKEEQAKQTFELYKKHKVNPFSGCFLVLIQIPIIFALYFVFLKGVNFEAGALYSFIHIPEHVNMIFFGVFDISKENFALAILAGVSQFLQAHFMPKPILSSNTNGSIGSFSESFAKSMHMQMKYVFPVFIFVLLYTGIPGVVPPLSGAVALYWITSNLFMVGQQIYVKKEKNFKMVIK
ncbi:hypothetical protein A2641_01415 [Candidatus Nomurabacteria bacterium RIFCSPHIGHO2_01_FULL_37_25]|uniref:Membrane insertase YidC/Oxa/ALB C-terminal domain-containing protein n=1 Tax=Candidatus Nomurabacteria bacterium RIFCSPLOWO2_01_FULL_36_16 TaxID=1801767 RepID=A0A1F6WYZ7_9BACT|nr:MAG: hypothetical protein A2641_01415 [Candidatus Nomurabacteria bacterium RIFCSPHIGHO2_01_FULL_37_25]OGI75370.1 MAG: hypothetical protein A3D36_02315 [Candidatus Nomurabacteria bacterium RIFCSPHIGHO2_02_FULL_36_29]OGI87117.1 MAG: hypothetical protein A3A91_00410 [Candidatus Nomurabacteria bacterium RIFCSPLOWO2_01_FULL_36_16]OGI97003.1 MAG: hypothetical protein A3I84_02455 [Candidatus Nomurabacteria bacterium RIFCSPLOWO2_02_FULL_36_8]